MAEFFSNIWAWITAHSGQIAALLTPANLVLVVGALVSIFRQKKTVAGNTASAKELAKSLSENKDLKDKMERLESEVANLRALAGDIADLNAQSNSKLNAILDVQQAVYAVSLRDTKTLDAVNGFIADGKFAETKSRREINEEMARLRAKIAELAAAGETSEKRVQKLTQAEVKPAPSGARYD